MPVTITKNLNYLAVGTPYLETLYTGEQTNYQPPSINTGITKKTPLSNHVLLQQHYII